MMNQNLSNVDYWIFGGSFFLVVLVNLNGPGYTYDSYDYFHASRNVGDFLSQHEIEFDKVIRRPPIFPILLSVFPDWSLRCINPLLFLLNAALFFQILVLQIRSGSLRSTIFAIFAFGIPIHLTHSFLWTEPLVILILLLQVYLILDGKNRYRYYILLPFLAVLMVLTKNGSMLLIIPIVFLAIRIRGINYQNVLILVTYILFAFFSFEFWSSWVEKTSVSGIAVRVRSFSLSYLDVFTGWFLPIILPLYFRIAILLIVFITVIVLLLRKRILVSSDTSAFLIMFTLYLLLRSYYSAVDYHESERYLSLGYPLFLFGVAGFLQNNEKKFSFRKFNAMTVGVGCWFLYSALRVLKNDFIWLFDRINL